MAATLSAPPTLRCGSTKPGGMFTGCRRWQAQLESDRFTRWVDSEPTSTLHVAQLRGVRLSTGVMWSTCHFDLEEGGARAARTVDTFDSAAITYGPPHGQPRSE